MFPGDCAERCESNGPQTNTRTQMELLYMFHRESAGKMIGFLYPYCNNQNPHDISLSFYKNPIRLKMMYCCHIWARIAQPSLSYVDRVQMFPPGITFTAGSRHDTYIAWKKQTSLRKPSERNQFNSKSFFPTAHCPVEQTT